MIYMGCGCGKGKEYVNIKSEIVCSNTVTTCGSINLPNGFTVTSLTEAVVVFNSTLICSVGTPIETTCTSEIDNCGSITVPIQFIPISLIGTIEYILSVPVVSPCSPAIGNINVSDSVSVNQVVCIASENFTCPIPAVSFCPESANITAIDFSSAPITCPNPTLNPKTIVASIEFTLPNICTQ